MRHPTPNAGGNFRWIICGLLFFSVALNYIDRNIIGILKMPLGAALGWSENDYGTIAATFNFAYAFGYLIGGRLIERLGLRVGLSGFVFFWSLAAMAHGLCGLIPAEARFCAGYPWFSFAQKGFLWATLVMPSSVLGFMAARVALGIAEGGNFPAAIKAVTEWFPQKERALATGLFNAGTNVGAVLCPLAVPWLFNRVGWESTFYITGALGFIWLVAWWFLYDSPGKSRHLSAAEHAHIMDGNSAGGPGPKKEPVRWRVLLGYRAVWAFVMAGILAGPVWGFYQFFLPDFLYNRYHLTLQEAGVWTGVFYALATAGGVVFGWLAGRFIARGWSVNAARKLSLLVCAMAVMPVFFAPHVPTVWLAVLAIGIAGSAHQGWSANLFSFVSDCLPKEAVSTAVGLGGFVSYFTGGFVAKAIGWTLEATGSYTIVFAWASLMYVISFAAIQFLVPKIPEPPKAGAPAASRAR
ncbi:MAG: MFS transporter [Opitutaceae bacterium]|jgi:ACS family hexuronate transporter-like MFS transporter|nr:MFS transporter [Opitutaceae bacterium]